MSTYSKSAMHQLIRIAAASGRVLNLAVPVPGEGHEDVRQDQEADGEDRDRDMERRHGRDS
jgi:hypothetical protein